MRVVCLNHHQPYINTLAATGIELDVVVRWRDVELPWRANHGDKPPNVTLQTDYEEVSTRIHSGYYDCVILHTISDLFRFFRFHGVRFVFVAHVALYRHTPGFVVKSWLKRFAWLIFKASHRADFVCVSNFKASTWHVATKAVIPLASQFEHRLSEKVQLDRSGAVTVGNDFAQPGRDRIVGYPLLKKIREQIPITIIGRNPGVPGCYEPSSYDDFLAKFRQASIFVYTIEQPFGDGYNTAAIEAMFLGHAICTVANPSSPIRHGIEGLVAKDADAMVTNMKTLLDKPELARELGRNAQVAAKKLFSQQSFVDKWLEVLGKS